MNVQGIDLAGHRIRVIESYSTETVYSDQTTDTTQLLWGVEEHQNTWKKFISSQGKHTNSALWSSRSHLGCYTTGSSSTNFTTTFRVIE